MIGMGFFAWLTLVIIAAVVSVVMYYALKLRLRAGYWAQFLVGWLGAWLGSPVFGHWFDVGWLHPKGVYIIPAALGAIALIWVYRIRERAGESE